MGIATRYASDIAKNTASAVICTKNDGIEPLISLVQIGRRVHHRLESWIVSKIAKTFQISLLILWNYLIRDEIIAQPIHMVILLVLLDLCLLLIGMDRVSPVLAPAPWRILDMAKIGSVLGVLGLVEALVLIYFGVRVLGVSPEEFTLQTFSFEVMFFFGLFTIFSVREKGRWWASSPRYFLVLLAAAETFGVLVACSVGVPYLPALHVRATGTIIAWSLGCVLFVNDAVKTWMYQSMQARYEAEAKLRQVTASVGP